MSTNDLRRPTLLRLATSPLGFAPPYDGGLRQEFEGQTRVAHAPVSDEIHFRIDTGEYTPARCAEITQRLAPR